MEVYLKSNSETLRFPVIPSEISKTVSADITSEKILKRGGINLFNGKEPGTVPVSGFFPCKTSTYSYIQVKGVDPYVYVNKLEKWCKEGTKLRYIVTDSPINIPVMISRFEYAEKDGTGDVYFSLDLKEWEQIIIPEYIAPKKSSSAKKPTVVNNPRPVQKPVAPKKRIHTVRKGEYLFMIAQKYYGNGWQYKKIKNLPENQRNYPKLKHSNYIYVGWKLVIP